MTRHTPGMEVARHMLLDKGAVFILDFFAVVLTHGETLQIASD
jgi:hypothetical protein